MRHSACNESKKVIIYDLPGGNDSDFQKRGGTQDPDLTKKLKCTDESESLEYPRGSGGYRLSHLRPSDSHEDEDEALNGGGAQCMLQ